jgi:hypothetical protein
MSTVVITSTILRKMSELNKWQRDFFLHHAVVFLRLWGRYTYLNIERYGQKNEATYRQHWAWVIFGRVVQARPNGGWRFKSLKTIYSLGKIAALLGGYAAKNNTEYCT